MREQTHNARDSQYTHIPVHHPIIFRHFGGESNSLLGPIIVPHYCAWADCLLLAILSARADKSCSLANKVES